MPPLSVFDQCMGESHETPWMHLKLRMLSSMEKNAEPLSHHPLGNDDYKYLNLNFNNMIYGNKMAGHGLYLAKASQDPFTG